MGYLQEGKNFFTGDITVDPVSKQALKDSLPVLANDSIMKDADVLPNEYVKERLIPAIHTLKQDDLVKLHENLKTQSRLKDLIGDIREVTVYVPRDGNALPAEQVVPDRIKSSFKSGFKDVTTFLTGVADLNNEAEKEEKLMGEIIASANRSAMKFDRYVLRGDGKQYGDNASEWTELDSWNRDINRPTKDKEISHNVENVAKADFVAVLNDVVAMAKSPGNTLIIDGKPQAVGGGTRLEKLAYLASWLSALEEGCDKVLPSMASEAISNTVTNTASTVFGTVGDTIGGVVGEFPKTTVLLVSVLAYGAYKTGNLVGWVVNTLTGSIPTRVIAKGASMFKLTQWAAPHLNKFADALAIWNTPAAAVGTTTAPDSASPETSKFNELVNNAIKSLKEGDATKKFPTLKLDGTIEETTLSSVERTKRIKKINSVVADYRSGKIILEQADIKIADAYAGNFVHLMDRPTERGGKTGIWGEVKNELKTKTGFREEITSASISKGIREMNKIEAFEFASENWELQNPEKATTELRNLETALKERDTLRQAYKLADEIKNRNIALEKHQARLAITTQVLTNNTTTTTPVAGSAPQTTMQAGQSANPEYGRIAVAIERAEESIGQQIQKIRELSIDSYGVDLKDLKLGATSAQIEGVATIIEAKMVINNTTIGACITQLAKDHPKSVVPNADAIKPDTAEIAMKRILTTIGKLKPKV